MRIELARLHDQLGATMIYVTHDQVEAMTLADKIVVLKDGRIEQVGSPLSLYHYPVNRFVAGFIGSPKMNFLDVTVDSVAEFGVTIVLSNGERCLVPASADNVEIGSKLALGIRPEHLEPGGLSAITGEVMVVERLGGQTYLYVQVPPGNLVIAEDGGTSSIHVHDTTSLSFDPLNCHLFRPDGSALTRYFRDPLVAAPSAAA